MNGGIDFRQAIEEAYLRGKDDGTRAAGAEHMRATVASSRRERLVAAAWCAVGLLAGVYLRGWWV
jgi:hypothetical protein